MTYSELVEWCGSESMAYLLSQQFDYENLSEPQVQNTVINLLIRMKKKADRKNGHAPVELEYLGGERRDTLRALGTGTGDSSCINRPDLFMQRVSE